MSKKNIEMAGYDFNLNLNQIGANNAGLAGVISSADILIFESFIKFSTWNKCEKIVLGNTIYYHYSWENVKNRIPYLGIKSRSGIKSRFKNLVTNELLKPHPNNNQMGRSYYAFGSKYEAYSNISDRTHPSTKTDAPVHQNGRTPSTKTDAPRPPKRTHPVHQNGRNDSTNDSTNDINMIFLKKEFQKFKNFAPTWNAWKEYLCKKGKAIQDEEQEVAAFQHLLNCADNHVTKAKKIITQAKAGGHTNLIPLLGEKKSFSKNDFPDEWNPSFFKKLEGEQIPKYWKHLREHGLRPVRHNGKIIKWAIPQPSTT